MIIRPISTGSSNAQCCTQRQLDKNQINSKGPKIGNVSPSGRHAKLISVSTSTRDSADFSHAKSMLRQQINRGHKTMLAFGKKN